MLSPEDRNQLLNDLVITLNCSLLRYVEEASMWTSVGEADVNPTLQKQLARRDQQITQLVELLVGRHWTIDFGGYPTEFTDLHYVSADFMFGKLVEDETLLVGQIESLKKTLQDDEAAATVLNDVLAIQRDIVAALKQLAAAHPVAAAA